MNHGKKMGQNKMCIVIIIHECRYCKLNMETNFTLIISNNMALRLISD